MFDILKEKVMIVFVIFFISIISIDAISTKRENQKIAKAEEPVIYLYN